MKYKEYYDIGFKGFSPEGSYINLPEYKRFGYSAPAAGIAIMNGWEDAKKAWIADGKALLQVNQKDFLAGYVDGNFFGATNMYTLSLTSKTFQAGFWRGFSDSLLGNHDPNKF